MILDLSEFTEAERNKFLSEARNSGWKVNHEKRPVVHPDRKSSIHFYSFSIADHVDKVRRDRSSGMSIQ